ncbi:hypothetical protein CVC14_25555 [Salmonella enterica subsp. enterica]|uniref:Uncharacterized protein n=2 Tax=Enterobacteriaceae TaxID=543 RepID=A0A626C9Y0_SALTM|nr:hypothetical protein [Salmonella enterica]EAW1507282.1 hypothetical protein [Salmonella enterica subsp. enterica]EBH9598218.1 hypothetical protein [Salmonella enterica subsp. enterica serovar Havana]EBU7983153.1 hypothetical protein [Salmonella enterica subsp. enterica serovar Enteritidis]EBW1823242.1 hypothetical protein [Salmonella enterica subsp. enterica serovar Typhimurium]ECD5853250.1 hypothetical protein [Salmonella enterica subsp. enterica serovar Kisangani]ECQ0422928.1 hypothetica
MVTVLLQASYRGSKERQLLRTFEKATLPGGFFVFRARDYDATERISRRSSVMFDRYGDMHHGLSGFN